MKRTITVTGIGEARGTPDIARVELGSETLAATVSGAREAANAAAHGMIEALKLAGVAPADIQSSHVSIQTQMEYPQGGPPRVTGYTAQNLLRVTLRDLSAAGAIIDSAVAAGGDHARLQGIQFSFAKPEVLATEARKRAIENARAHATTFAKAAGVKVGQVFSITEETNRGAERPMAFAAQRLEAKSTPLETGESAITVSVTVRFAIKD